MPEAELSESAEEILADLWLTREEKNETSLPSSALDGDDANAAAHELTAAGLIEDKSGRISLTEVGEREAARIVRRERLAERLLVDVLNLGEGAAAEAACKFEHLLRKGIDDEICTLLGHPRICPHGSPIPPGECCRAGARAARKVVSALTDLAPGQRGVIAYIHGRRREEMQRLLAMGAIPGMPLELLQKFPSYVFQIGHGQIAVDRETAQDIYVRLTERPAPPPSSPSWFLRPLRRMRFRRGRRGR